MTACILLPTRSLNGDTDCATTLLDLQRRPTPLPLGHSFRKGQGNVARRRGQARRDSRPEAGAQGRPGTVLPRSSGAHAVFHRGSHARSVPGSARPQGEKTGRGPASLRKAASAGGPGGNAREPGAAENEIAEECALDSFADHRLGVSGNPAHGRNRRDAANSAALRRRAPVTAVSYDNLLLGAHCPPQIELR